MDENIISPQKSPYPIMAEKGKTYFWCQCGRSNKQPFCDGSHKGTKFQPVKYTSTETKKIFFCGCKFTTYQPICDGTHSKK